MSMSVFLLLIGQLLLYANVYDASLDYTYNDSSYAVVYDSCDNTYVMAGHTDDGVFGGIDVLVVKINANTGALVWAWVYGVGIDTANDYAHAITIDYEVETDSVYYVVAGYTQPGPLIGADALVFKIRTDGSLVWGNVYGGWVDPETPGHEYLYAVVKDGSDYLVAGNLMPDPWGGMSDVLVFKVNAVNGGVIWSRIYGKVWWIDEEPWFSDEYGYTIINDSSYLPVKNFVVAGMSYLQWENVWDMLVFRADKDSGYVVGRIYDYIVTGWNTCAYEIKNDPPQFVVVGDADSYYGLSPSIVVMKLNSNLTVGWGGTCRIYSVGDTARGRSIVRDDTTYVVTGYTTPGLTNSMDMLVMKLHSSGFPMWTRTLVGCTTLTWMTSDDYGQCIIRDVYNHYIVAGYTGWPGNWGTNFLIAKMNTDGIIICQQTGDSCLREVEPTVDTPGVKMDSSLLQEEYPLEWTGIFGKTVSLRDSTICMSEETGVGELKDTGTIRGVSSCPCMGGTVIYYYLEEEVDVRLAVYDAIGREIRTLVNERKQRGLHSVKWDGCDQDGNKVKAGVYFCVIKVNGTVATRKMILIR